MNADLPPDYQADSSKMPRPYVTFEMRPQETRDAEGKVTYTDVAWAKVMAPGTRDVLEKKADDWVAGLRQHADGGRIPSTWPDEYANALKSFIKGEELPVHGTPIRTWPPLTPAQRKAVLGANVLTVEDLANANDEMKTRIGMGANNLVQIAQTWVKDAAGPGALAAKLDAALVAQAESDRRYDELKKAFDELAARVPKEAVPA